MATQHYRFQVERGGNKIHTVMTSDYYRAYENEFKEQINFMVELLQNISSDSINRLLLEKGEKALYNADVCLKQMDMEARTLPNCSFLLDTIHRYRDDLMNIRNSFQRIVASGANQSTNTSRAMDSMGMLENSSEALQESNRLAVETEEVGINIMSHLQQQRRTLLHSSALAEDTYSTSQGAKGILKRMIRDTFFNKVVLLFIILLLLLCIGLVIVRKFIS